LLAKRRKYEYNRKAIAERHQKSHWKPKRILITGGAGFVGSHLTDVLMREGHRVTVVDNFVTGSPDNVRQWKGHENFKLIERDVTLPVRTLMMAAN